MALEQKKNHSRTAVQLVDCCESRGQCRCNRGSAAILDDGGVIAYGREAAGGTLPDLVNRNRDKRTAVNLFVTRFAFLVTLSNSTAIIWGDLAENGMTIEKEGNDICQVSGGTCRHTGPLYLLRKGTWPRSCWDASQPNKQAEEQ